MQDNVHSPFSENSKNLIPRHVECEVLRIMRGHFKSTVLLWSNLFNKRTLHAAHLEIACAIRIQRVNWFGIDLTHYRSQSVWSRRAHVTDLDTGKPRSKDWITQTVTCGKGTERRKISQVRCTHVYWTEFWKNPRYRESQEAHGVVRRRMCRVRPIGSRRPFVHTHKCTISSLCIELE